MKQKKDKTITLTIDSLALAVFLLAKDCKLLSIDKTNPRRAIFMFDDSNHTKVLTEQFWQWEASVEPRQFFAKQKELKSMLFSPTYPSTRTG